MGRLSLLMTVVSRNLGEKYLKFYLEQQVDVQPVTLGRGTANDAMLDYFGLESHEKAVLFSVVDDQKWEEQVSDCTGACALMYREQESHF